MKTYTETKREWQETTASGVVLYHSPELDRIHRQWGDIAYKRQQEKEAQTREARRQAGDYSGFGNGLLKYTPEVIDHLKKEWAAAFNIKE